jgi:hypothetical protein
VIESELLKNAFVQDNINNIIIISCIEMGSMCNKDKDRKGRKSVKGDINIQG